MALTRPREFILYAPTQHNWFFGAVVRYMLFFLYHFATCKRSERHDCSRSDLFGILSDE